MNVAEWSRTRSKKTDIIDELMDTADGDAIIQVGFAAKGENVEVFLLLSS